MTDLYCAVRECSHKQDWHDPNAGPCSMPGCECSTFASRPTKGPIYVAGPMTGLPEFNFPAFNAAAEMLRADGWAVENPADNGSDTTHPWDFYMRAGIVQLVKCSAILTLPGWQMSRGAILENRIARDLGMEHYHLFEDGKMVKYP